MINNIIECLKEENKQFYDLIDKFEKNPELLKDSELETLYELLKNPSVLGNKYSQLLIKVKAEIERRKSSSFEPEEP